MIAKNSGAKKASKTVKRGTKVPAKKTSNAKAINKAKKPSKPNAKAMAIRARAAVAKKQGDENAREFYNLYRNTPKATYNGKSTVKDYMGPFGKYLESEGSRARRQSRRGGTGK